MTPLFVNDFDRVKNFRDEYPLVGKIFEQPVSFWFGKGRNKKNQTPKKVYSRIQRLLDRTSPAEPVIVIYNLPDRDLGQYSKGGAESKIEYIDFIDSIARGIGRRQPIVIFEPDALPHSTHMEKAKQTSRLRLMKDALEILDASTDAHIYVDIGHSNWLAPDDAAKLLNKVHAEGVRGFSVNVSNYRTTKESMDWALRVAETADAPQFVIDTSRNGNGPHGNDWCNPPDRALGTPPTFETDHNLCDAYLWIKIPGESDGKCNGGPRAGRFWPDHAQELIVNSTYP